MNKSKISLLAGVVTPIMLVLGMFWLDAITYVGIQAHNGLNVPLYRAIFGCFVALSLLWVVGAWLTGRLLAGLAMLISCIVAGELPWRLTSRGRLDWLWPGWDSSDIEKITAGECLAATPYILAGLTLAILVEAIRLGHRWHARSTRRMA